MNNVSLGEVVEVLSDLRWKGRTPEPDQTSVSLVYKDMGPNNVIDEIIYVVHIE